MYGIEDYRIYESQSQMKERRSENTNDGSTQSPEYICATEVMSIHTRHLTLALALAKLDATGFCDVNRPLQQMPGVNPMSTVVQ